MAKPETIQPMGTSPETSPGSVAMTPDESEAPSGRFFDSAKQAGHLSLVPSAEVIESTEANLVAGPSRPLKPGAQPVTQWGLGWVEDEGHLGQYYFGDESLDIKKQNVATLVKILLEADGQRVEFVDLLKDKRLALRGDKPAERNMPLQGLLEETVELFKAHDIPYLIRVADKEAGEHYYILQKELLKTPEA